MTNVRENDEGELAVKMSIEKGHLVLDFGKSLTWLALHKQGVRDLINVLEEHYKRL